MPVGTFLRLNGQRFLRQGVQIIASTLCGGTLGNLGVRTQLLNRNIHKSLLFNTTEKQSPCHCFFCRFAVLVGTEHGTGIGLQGTVQHQKAAV